MNYRVYDPINADFDNPNTRWEWYASKCKNEFKCLWRVPRTNYDIVNFAQGTATDDTVKEGVWWHCELEEGEQVWLHLVSGETLTT